MNFDTSILDWIQNFCYSANLDNVMKIFSAICDHGEIWILTAFVMFFLKQQYLDENIKVFILKKYRIYSILLLISVILTFLICQIVLKEIFDRPRPFIENPDIAIIIPAPNGSSFPSAHSAVSFASAFILLRFNKNIGLSAYILALFIAFSRLYLQVHYPTDVIAGALIGTIIAAAVYFTSKTIINKQIKTPLPI
ncbi:MAG: phosphatase PAP2 family protein [Clostridia bacterium]|nr:phosphatase PAP2 family protein [Clostridia bacterium]